MNVLHPLLLAAHLVCVNIASGGPLVAAWLDWRGTRGDAVAARAARDLAAWSLLAFLAGAALGLFVGWLKWDAAYRALWLGPLSYKLHGAILEAAFSLALLLAWRWWLPGRAGGSGVAAAGRGLLAVLASTNLLYHFPLLFSVAARLSDAGQVSGERIGGAAFRRLMIAGETPALAIHVALASLAMAGFVLLGLALRALSRGDAAGGTTLAIWGGRWALVPSLLQLPVGLWTLATLPAAAQSQIMGGSTAGTLLMVASLLAAFWLITDLLKVALGETTRPLLFRSMAAMMITVVLMTAMQQQTRGS